MTNPKLTIYTPTYNRAYILPRLYQSLKSQDRNDFVWIVVDDGSTDGTKVLVESWITEADFEIQYIYQKHGGKARAQNRAVLAANTPFFTGLESDDEMVPNGVDMIYQNLKHFDNPAVLYLIFSCKHLNCDEISPFPATDTTLNWRQLASHYNCETSVVHKTETLKRYLYPEFEGELYISPAYVLNQIPDQYVGYAINSPLRLIEYLPDGISNNRKKIKCGNFKGWTLVKNQNLKYTSGFCSLIKMAGVYDAYAILSGKKHFISTSSKPLWALIALPAGIWYMITVLLWGKWVLSRKSKKEK